MGRLGARRGDAGAGALEYIGVTLVVGLLVAAVFTVFGGAPIASQAASAVQCYLGQGCADGDGGTTPVAAGPDGGSADAGDSADEDEDETDRGDTARDARGDRRDDARRDDDDTEQDPGAPGDPGSESPSVGDGVPGTTPVFPDPPPWEPVDAGAGDYDSEDADLRLRATEVAAEVAANAMSGRWPEAARNLLHFLGGSGDALEQDVDAMLGDLPEFQQATDETRQLLINQAIAQAQADGATGPVTFPISSGWTGFGYDANGQLVYDSQNYFYALGGWQYSETGYVTVTPPSTPGGEWTYTSETTTHLRDQYNWDGSKSTNILGVDITDEQLAELHRAGLAQEFTAYGQSSTRRTEGSTP
ncbi:hypothetical protein [Jannaschia sp. R86511]|uniref:hypothetical protein n=1 Tax=Jannaschia sp. R86511 TaxID=3093853 RepID=UPI0036D2E923